MHPFTFFLIRIILIGLGATFMFDLWGLFLKHIFKIAPSNICLVGRWLRYMPEGIFQHANLAAAPAKKAECAVGWVGHYTIGIGFTAVFVAALGNSWLQHPTLFPALLFGVVTVIAPFFIMQPAFGLGIAAAKTAHRWQARVRTLMNHLAFGLGLYVFGLFVGFVL